MSITPAPTDAQPGSSRARRRRRHAPKPHTERRVAALMAAEASKPTPSLDGVFAGLLPSLRRALHEQGYRAPTPIQEAAIPPLLEGRDLYGSAQTGTGKTAAFTLPLIQQLENDRTPCAPGAPLALILAPTRELARQIGDSLEAYARHTSIRHTVIFGGVGQHPQVKALRNGVHVVVATPGRLLDLMQQKALHLREVRYFVLDEGDRMLDMGFIPDIRRIAKDLPAKRQSLLFSATLPKAIEELADTLVHNPVRIAIAPEQPAVERISQKVLFVSKQNKMHLLKGMLADPAASKVIVFTRMKHAANKIAKKLESEGIPSAALHGNKSQQARTRALDQFKHGQARVLVATDIAARGLDVDGVSHVINFDLPEEAETYVHRIGRTARAGAGGDAVSFCSAEERSYLRDIERLLKAPVPPDTEHAYHCQAAQQAEGAAARPAPRQQRGGSRNRRPGRRFRGR